MDLYTPLRVGVRLTAEVVRLATAVPRAVLEAVAGRDGDGDRFVPTAEPVGRPPAPPPAPAPAPAPPPRAVAAERPVAPPPPPPPRPRPRVVGDEPAPAETEGAADPGAEVHVEAPWDGYDGMRAQEIVSRLRRSDASTKAVVRLYEQQHKKRKSVLSATEG